MKKNVSVLAAVLLSGVSLNSQAVDFFVGVEAGVAIYPDFTTDVAKSIGGSVTVEQDAGSFAAGIYGGAWLTENFGVEVAYADLGSIEGKVKNSSTFYEYAATAFSASLLVGTRAGKGTLYGKVGMYDASVKFKSITRSITTDSSGLVFGGGYSLPFTKHVVGKVELAAYNDVQFQKFNAPVGTNTGDNIYKFAVGVAYTF
jgi:Outer membrane protein beta-barrel domain